MGKGIYLPSPSEFNPPHDAMRGLCFYIGFDADDGGDYAFNPLETRQDFAPSLKTALKVVAEALPFKPEIRDPKDGHGVTVTNSRDTFQCQEDFLGFVGDGGLFTLALTDADLVVCGWFYPSSEAVVTELLLALSDFVRQNWGDSCIIFRRTSAWTMRRHDMRVPLTIADLTKCQEPQV